MTRLPEEGKKRESEGGLETQKVRAFLTPFFLAFEVG